MNEENDYGDLRMMGLYVETVGAGGDERGGEITGLVAAQTTHCEKLAGKFREQWWRGRSVGWIRMGEKRGMREHRGREKVKDGENSGEIVR